MPADAIPPRGVAANAPADLLTEVSVDASAGATLGTQASLLRIARAWPRSRQHVLLEYVDASGRSIAGQWVGDEDHADRVVRRTREADPGARILVIHNRAGLPIVLHADGADRALPGLRPLLDRGGTLVSHQPERQAVVRGVDEVGTWFAKVTRPGRGERVFEIAEALASAPGLAFRAPLIERSEPSEGVLVMRGLPGRAWHEQLAGTQGQGIAIALGAALRSLHESSPPPGAGVHEWADEASMLRTRLHRTGTVRPDLDRIVPPRRVEAAIAALENGTSRRGTLHRDLHDKQVIATEGGRLGLLDFDTVAVGERALDIGNVLAHLELRSLQGRCGPRCADGMARAFLNAYAPEIDVLERIPAYLDATRLRLACVYALRPVWLGVSARLIAISAAHVPGSA